MLSNSHRSVLAAAVAMVSLAAPAIAGNIYNSIDSTLLGSYPSQPFQAQQTFEFGDRVTFGGTDRKLGKVTVTMVNWARYEDYNLGGQYYGSGEWAGSGFTHDLTFNIYGAGSGTTPGSLIASITKPTAIAYRPTGWSFNGYAQNVTFDFSSLNLVLPEEVVWGIAYNTQTWGANPLGVDGPFDSLNVGCNTAPGGGITIGSTDLDRVFWNTQTAAWYADGGAAGVGIYREDTNWTGYNPMVSFDANAVPEPASLSVLGLGAAALLMRRRAVR